MGVCPSQVSCRQLRNTCSGDTTQEALWTLSPGASEAQDSFGQGGVGHRYPTQKGPQFDSQSGAHLGCGFGP